METRRRGVCILVSQRRGLMFAAGEQRFQHISAGLDALRPVMGSESASSPACPVCLALQPVYSQLETVLATGRHGNHHYSLPTLVYY